MLTPERRTAWLRLVLPVLILASALAACGGSAGAPVPLFGDSADGGADVTSSAEYRSSAAASAAPAVEVPAAEAAGGQPPVDANGDPLTAPRDDLKIVYTGSLDLVVDDLQAALAKARAAVLATGGYVGASRETNDDDRSVATITYRVPAARWDDALTSLRGLATKVVGEETQATEVGGQIVDLEARIRNLRASEQVLVDIAKGTGKVSDLLEVEARITDVRGQIEQLDGQRTQLEDQVTYGTLVTTFGTQIAQVQETAKGWDPTADVDGATATLIGAGQTIVSGTIWFGIVWLPVILLLLVLALIARWAFRRFMPKAAPVDPVAGWGGEG